MSKAIKATSGMSLAYPRSLLIMNLRDHNRRIKELTARLKRIKKDELFYPPIKEQLDDNTKRAKSLQAALNVLKTFK